MALEQRRLLEAMMGGAEALVGIHAAKPKLAITDPKVCHCHLVGICAHEMFGNTKSEMGTCTKVHSEQLKKEFQAASEEQRREWDFEYELYQQYENCIKECDRRIVISTENLVKNDSEVAKEQAMEERITRVASSFAANSAEAHGVGQDNSATLSLFAMAKQRALLQTKKDLDHQLFNLRDNSGSSGHQKLEVCSSCSAYLSRLDNNRRLADHFAGKMHIGYAKMREAIIPLRERYADRASREINRRNDSYASSGGRRDNRRGGFDRHDERRSSDDRRGSYDDRYDGRRDGRDGGFGGSRARKPQYESRNGGGRRGGRY